MFCILKAPRQMNKIIIYITDKEDFKMADPKKVYPCTKDTQTVISAVQSGCIKGIMEE